MRTNSTWLVYCVTISLLTGCVTMQDKNAPLQKTVMEDRKIDSAQPKQGVVPVAAQSTQVGDLLKYAQAFTAMPAEAQKKEIVRLPKEKTGLVRIQLVLALVLPASHYRDIPRALTLLDEELKDNTHKDNELRNFSTVLKALLVDHQKLDDGLQQQTQKLKDEQKHSYELQQKLEDLKNLEKMMNQERPK